MFRLNFHSFINCNFFRSPRAQQYLIRVYANLAVTTAMASVAVILYMRDMIPEMGSIGMAGSVLLPLAISLSRGMLSDRIRLGMLWSEGFLVGWGIGPLTQMLFDLDGELLIMAVIGTFIAFVSFSGAALFSQRRSYLYLGGLLSAASLILLITSFFPSMFNVNLYLGLFTFCFYIIYDTQMLVERTEMMVSDQMGLDGALQLFMNLYAIFVRLMIILMKNRQPRERKDKKRK